MNSPQGVEARLRERLNVLRERLEEIDEDLGEPGDDDSAEMAVEIEGDEVLVSVSHAADTEVEHILLALERLRTGEYGSCSKCGKDIGAPRLEAIPYAAHCIDCARGGGG